MQQKSEILMLNTKLITLRKEHEKLVDIHTKYKSQRHSDIQTDQVIMINSSNCIFE